MLLELTEDNGRDEVSVGKTLTEDESGAEDVSEETGTTLDEDAGGSNVVCGRMVTVMTLTVEEVSVGKTSTDDDDDDEDKGARVEVSVGKTSTEDPELTLDPVKVSVVGRTVTVEMTCVEHGGCSTTLDKTLRMEFRASGREAVVEVGGTALVRTEELKSEVGRTASVDDGDDVELVTPV